MSLLELWFEGYIKLDEDDIERYANGDFLQAVQDALGLTDAVISRSNDDFDNQTLAQRREEDS